MTATLSPAEIRNAVNSRLPGYADTLLARHEAHRDTFEAIVQQLPLGGSSHVLDVGCGDGFFAGLILSRLESAGRVTGLDISQPFLSFAEQHYADSSRYRSVEGDASELKFDDSSFDLIWCAHSFRSFPNPSQALAEMVRVVKPGGSVVVLENDRLHQALLPWPADLEWSVYAAERRARSTGPESGEQLELGRRLLQMFRSAGLAHVSKRTWTTDRWQPLSDADRFYLRLLFEDIAERIEPHLQASDRSAILNRLDCDHKDGFLRQADFEVTFCDSVAIGEKPIV